MDGNTVEKRPVPLRRASPSRDLAMTILSHLNLRSASRLLLTAGAVGLLAACSSEPEQPKGPTPEEIAKEAQGAFVASVPAPTARASARNSTSAPRGATRAFRTTKERTAPLKRRASGAWSSRPTRRRSRAPRSSSSPFSRTIRAGRPFRRDPPFIFSIVKANPSKGGLPSTTSFARTDGDGVPIFSAPLCSSR